LYTQFSDFDPNPGRVKHARERPFEASFVANRGFSVQRLLAEDIQIKSKRPPIGAVFQVPDCDC